MNISEFTHYTIGCILRDYKSIFYYIRHCMDNKSVHPGITNVLPYISMLVYEGNKFLKRNGIIKIDSELEDDIRKLNHFRSMGIKLYSEFNLKQYCALNDFNKNEYEKFYKKAYPLSKVHLVREVNNYFLHIVNGILIGNYHLYAQKIFETEIGSYNDNISVWVGDYTYLVSNFISSILSIFEVDMISPQDIKGLKFDDKYVGINMAYAYKNFSIQDNPPILMALLDLVCNLNFFENIFSKINKDLVLDLKLKYCVIFYSILSIKKILEFCISHDFAIDKSAEFYRYVVDLESQYVCNRLRVVCMHYDLEENSIEEFKSDPFKEQFEHVLGKDLWGCKDKISKVLKELSEELNDFVIKKGFY